MTNLSDFTGIQNRMTNALIESGKNCTGCGACKNICPVNAIEMQENKWGFLIPAINNDICINCGKCEHVCPKLFTPQNDNRQSPDCYAAQGPDSIRQNSSSGGIFSLLANYILTQEKNGVVYGVTIDSDFNVYHTSIRSTEALSLLQKSKYVQSNTGWIYRDVEKDLKAGMTVLFSGCPCQVAALQNYLGKEYPNLYLVDILCHGVPSNRMLKDYIIESFNTPQAESIDFRDKRAGWRADCLSVYYKDKTNRIFTTPESEYEIGFQHNVALRDSCTQCEFCGYQRQGDITLGDFWHVEDYRTEWKDGKGTSIILANNEKADKLLEKLIPQLQLFEKAPIEAAARYNRLKADFKSHPMKNRFRTLYPAAKKFCEAIRQAYEQKFDIGLVGHWTTRNYGGSLTCWALYNVLTDMGYSVTMILPPKNAEMKGVVNKPPFFYSPIYPEYACDRRHENLDDMKELNDRCKMFVVASDQLFNNNLYRWLGQFQILDWVYQSRKKIAYAASYGHDYIWGNDFERAYMSNFMKKFDFFSVREDSGVALSKREFGVDAEWVLDPIFLCKTEHYQKLADEGNNNVPKQPYLFSYVLDPDENKQNTLLKCASYLQKPLYAMHDAASGKPPVVAPVIFQELTDTEQIHVLKGSMTNDFLAYIRSCDFMITDSFHGMCFAILFRKPFVAIANRLRGLTRFTSILRLLHLENRLVYSLDDLSKHLETLLTPIDYEPIYHILEEEQNRCKFWLENALQYEQGSQEKRSLSDYDALNVRCDVMVREYNGRIDQLIKNISQSQNIFSQLSKDQADELYYQIMQTNRSVEKITWIPKKIKSGIRCIKDHGFRYTIKYGFSKFIKARR